MGTQQVAKVEATSLQVPVAAPAPVPTPAPDVRDAVSSGPQIRDQHGRFSSKPVPATPETPAVPIPSPTGLPIDDATQAERDKLYDEWPEMAVSTWGPRPEKPTPEQPEAQDALKAEAASTAPVSDTDTQALKLAGFTDAAIAKLAPEDITVIAEAQRQRNAGVEAKLREAAEVRKQQTVEATPKESAKPRPLPEALKAKTKKLGDAIGSDEAGELIAELVEDVRSEFREQQEAAQTAAFVVEINKARSDLGERLPAVRDEAKFRAILDEVDDMRETKRWKNKPIAETIAAACQTLYPGPTPAQLQADRLQQQGLATPLPASTPAKAARTHQKFRDPFDTAAHAAFNALGEKATVKEAAEEARRALHGE